MKKTGFFLLAALTISSFSQAQTSSDLKPFKVDVSVGYAAAAGKGAKGGVLFAIEPKYAVMEDISLGLRIESAAMARFGGYSSTGAELNSSVKASGSYLLTADYYLRKNYSFRPFLGVGAGVYKSIGIESSGASTGIDASRKFGGLVRVGAEIRHFRLGLEYNIVSSSKFYGYNASGSLTDMKSKNAYLGLKAGIVFGGGPRK